MPYKFWCVSDHEIKIRGVETILATPTLQGWWAKLDYFRPGLFEGPCIALDLDITITGDIGPLVRNTLTAARETRRQTKMNSSVMSWTPSATTDAIWTPEPPAAKTFDKNNRDAFFGDQIYIAHRYPQYELYGDEVMMFKKHLEWGAVPLPEETAIVFFNGEPKPHRPQMMDYDWNAVTFEGYDLPQFPESQRCRWDGHYED